MSPVASDFKSDLKAAKKMRLPSWVFLPGVIATAFLASLFDHFGRLYLFLPLLNSVLVFGLLITLKWSLRTRIWFWITMGIFAALHAPLILLIPWTIKWVPALAIGIIDSLDFCLLLALLSIVGNFVERSKASRG
jgi:hypothetical protein